VTTEVAPPTAAKALAILGSSSLITIIAGIASAKVAALLIGPSGVGLVGLVQGVSAVVAALIELGFVSSIVRMYSSAPSEGPAGFTLTDLGAIARRVIVAAGLVVVVLVGVAAPLVTDRIFGADRGSLDLVLAATAGLPVALTAIENGLLIAAHRIKAVARAAVSIAFVSPLVNLAWFASLGEDGVAPGALCSAVAVLAVTSTIRRWELRGHTARGPERPEAQSPRRVRRALLQDGVPVMTSALVGSAAVLLLPVIVAGRLGRDGVGYYRAANVISLGYTAAVVTVISSDFLPRVSRVSASPAEFRALVVKQINLLVAVLVPLLAVTGAFLPLVVTVLYRDDFAPTVLILEWQLVGDLLRVVGSVLATAVFARFGGTARLASEAVGLGLLVGMSTFGLFVDGIRGLGWGFLATYVVYVALLWVILAVSGAGADAKRCLALLVVGSVACVVPPLAVHITGSAGARRVGLLVALAWVVPFLRQRHRQRKHEGG
jgi:O-antigen/teichoic acid export membrane protein